MVGQIPQDFVGLFIALVLGLLALLTWVIKDVTGGRREIVATQKEIIVILNGQQNADNRSRQEVAAAEGVVLREIAAHMATTNLALEYIRLRLLDAALDRKKILDQAEKAT